MTLLLKDPTSSIKFLVVDVESGRKTLFTYPGYLGSVSMMKNPLIWHTVRLDLRPIHESGHWSLPTKIISIDTVSSGPESHLLIGLESSLSRP